MTHAVCAERFGGQHERRFGQRNIRHQRRPADLFRLLCGDGFFRTTAELEHSPLQRWRRQPCLLCLLVAGVQRLADRRREQQRRYRDDGGRPYRDFWDAATRARADFVTMAAARHHQLAVGGVIKLPAMDKQGNPVRMHTDECKTPNSCRCEVIYIDKVVMPSERALEFELDRLDPIGPAEEQMPEQPGQTRAEIEAEGARHIDLFYSSVKVL